MKQKINKIKNFSISEKLKAEKKSNEYFESMLCNLHLEDVIALRLELSYRNTGLLLYNLPLWKSLDYIIKDSLLKYSVSVNDSKKKSAEFLGLNLKEFKQYYLKYNIEKYFCEGEIK